MIVQHLLDKSREQVDSEGRQEAKVEDIHHERQQKDSAEDPNGTNADAEGSCSGKYLNMTLIKNTVLRLIFVEKIPGYKNKKHTLFAS